MQERSDQTATGLKPGSLSELLRELAAAPSPDTLPEVPAPTLDPGTVIGRFELRREIGRGGFGVVYEAFDQGLRRSVAFKLVRAGRTELGEGLLQAEAEAIARLSHPNLVTLFDVGQSRFGPYLVLELLRGRTLEERIRQGPLPLPEVLSIALEMARGLAHAHGEGVVHRDLKPSNVFLCERGPLKLLDFGMAHAFGRQRVSGGTPAYMAPEQWRRAPEDERTDVFAFGVLLHRMIAGTLPYPDDGGKAVSGPGAAPPLRVPELPALGALVDRMLAKDMTARPRSGAEVLAALEAATTVGAPRAGPAAGADRRLRRRRALFAAALLAAAAALGGRFLLRRGGPLPAGQRPLVAVADIANATGDRDLDDLAGLLTTALEQSRWLEVVPRARQLDLLHETGRQEVGRIDEGLGRQVGLAAEAAALVLPSIGRFDRLYAIDVKVIEPRTGALLLAASEQAPAKAAIPSTIDRLAGRVREGLREAASDLARPQVRMASAVTHLEAYQHYFRGMEVLTSRPAEGVAEFQAALAIDPAFPLAHYGLSFAYEFYGSPGRQRAELEAALAGADRLPAKERMLVEAWKLHLDEREEEAHALYAQAAQAYPQDKRVQVLAAQLYFHEEDFARAIPYFERARALGMEEGTVDLATSYTLTGRAPEAVETMRGLARRSPYEPFVQYILAQALVVSGRADEGIAGYPDPARLGRDERSVELVLDRIWLLLQARRWREAERDARRLLDGPPAGARPGAVPAPLPVALAYQGRLREALALMPSAVDRAALLAGLGDAAATRRAVDEALDAAAPGTRLQGVRRFRYVAPVLLEYVGEVGRALELAAPLPAVPARRFYRALARWHAGGDLSELRALAGEPGHPAAQFFLGEALLSQGDAPGAARALRRFQAGFRGGLFAFAPWRPGYFDAWALPRSHLLLARALEQQGDRAGAAAAVGALLEMWRDADADLPPLAEAKALRARLGPSAR